MTISQWTPERRLRQSQLIHNWKPWQKGTGAKTLEGKEISKMNAFKHGAFSAPVEALWRELRSCDRAISLASKSMTLL